MSKTENPDLDQAKTGGGIGDIGRQPLDPSSENVGNADPVIGPNGDEDDVETAEGGLVVDGDPTPSGEDPDDEADETLGTIV